MYELWPLDKVGLSDRAASGAVEGAEIWEEGGMMDSVRRLSEKDMTDGSVNEGLEWRCPACGQWEEDERFCSNCSADVWDYDDVMVREKTVKVYKLTICYVCGKPAGSCIFRHPEDALDDMFEHPDEERQALKEIKSLSVGEKWQHEDGEIECIEMTQEEFDNLPEFMGW